MIQIGQLILLQLQRLQSGQRVRVIHLTELDQEIEHRAQVRQLIVESLSAVAIRKALSSVLRKLNRREGPPDRVLEPFNHSPHQQLAPVVITQRMTMQNAPAIEQFQQPALILRSGVPTRAIDVQWSTD
ncbi:hypothetical protein QM333_34410, partial [Pseudomonas aeruginosa]